MTEDKMHLPPIHEREFWSDALAIVFLALVKALAWLIGQ